MDDKIKIEIRELAKLETTGLVNPYDNPYYLEWLETGCVTLPGGSVSCTTSPNWNIGFN
jgi:hypothetical protein